MWRYWPRPVHKITWSYPGYYYYPEEFGFRWGEITEDYKSSLQVRYPYHYWSLPNDPTTDGAVSMNLLKDTTDTVDTTTSVLTEHLAILTCPGDGARMTFPIVDITDSSISGIKMYVDVLHNRADNYQDRMDIVARVGNDPADLGAYLRDSGTASFKNGMITGADTGIAVGGNFASGSFDSIDITSPTDAQGVEITGTTTASMDDIEVDGGNYGILVSSSSGSGNMDMTNIDFDGQNNAGVYYVKDLGGETLRNHHEQCWCSIPIRSTDNERTRPLMV